MSALAHILKNNNYEVSGSDINSTLITDKLKANGIKIYHGHNESNVIGSDLVVRSSAINDENTEIKKARELNIPIMNRSMLLGNIMKLYKYPVAVSGTHGKTTTTSMLSSILLEDKKDPTVLVGEMLKKIGGNYRIGNSDFFVTEACEYCESFLDFIPYIGLILNIEEDHLDYYKDLDHIISSFNKFAKLIPEDGHLVVCADNNSALKSSYNVKCNVITYGINNSTAHWIAKDININKNNELCFDCYYKGQNQLSLKLRVPGVHNIYNSLAAIASAKLLGVNDESIVKALNSFEGANRRFQIKGKRQYTIVSDYAHHPTEIKATLQAARQYKYNKVWCIFQPHTYSRTISLLEDFAKSFNDADELIITDIYAAREKDEHKIHSRDLVKKINETGKKVRYMSSFEDIKKYINKSASKNDLVITMGAGSIDRLSDILIS